MEKYFNVDATADGISGDDVNRRLRESRLGWSEPSPDWANCKKITRCIWGGQRVNTLPIDVTKHHFHRMPILS